MIVELHGARFKNKGAELMLRTALQELSKRIPNLRFAVDASVGTSQRRREMGLLQILPHRRWIGSPYFKALLKAQRAVSPVVTYLLRAGILDSTRFVAPRQVDALVDIAGFAYTDQWGTAPVRDFSYLVRSYSQAGKPVVLMPQAFGPFERDGSRRSMQRVLRHASKVHARDEMSEQYLRDLSCRSSSIALRPDITLFYPDTVDRVRAAEEAPYGCLIPNVRIVDQGAGEWAGRYVKRLVQIGNELQDQGVDVKLLVHDSSGGDLKLARAVAEKISERVDIVDGRGPLELKGIIANSRLVVSSRYHGCIAAFSRAVPSMCMGWSHKYEMLYKDFGCADHIVTAQHEDEHVQAVLSNMLDARRNNETRKHLFDRIQALSAVNNRMWDEVADLLRGPHKSAPAMYATKEASATS